MNCKKCGNPITNFDKFCQSCGEPNEFYNVQTTTTMESQNQQVASSQPEVIENQISMEPTENVVVENTENPIEMPVAPQEIIEPNAVVQTNGPIMENPSVGSEETAVMPENTNMEVPTQTEQPNISEEGVTPPEQVPLNIENEPPKKSGNKLFIILVIVLSLIIIGVGVFIITKVITGNKNTNKNNTKTVQKTETKETTKDTNVPEQSKFKLNGYTFTIPSNFRSATDEKNNLLVGADNFYLSFMKITNHDSYDTVKTKFPTLATTYINEYEQQGIEYVESGEYTYSNKKYLIMSFSYDNMYMDLLLTELKDGSIFSSYVYYTSTNVKEAGYKSITELVNSGEKDTSDTFSETPGDSEVFNNNGRTNPKVKFE